MKKHTLTEHWNDVSMWWVDSHEAPTFQNEGQVVFFIAYERWLNDRELLTVEDNYEWRWTPVPSDSRRSGTIL